jgi:uncharacterized protein YajQ (UPF0234 family)
MKFLTDQREKRDAKKLKETELARQAKDVATQFGDPNAAGSFYKELTNGVSYETLQKRIADGDIQKNPDYVAPARTVKMPSAVTMEPADSQFPVNEKVNSRIDAIDPTLRQSRVEEDNGFSTLATDDPNSAFIYKPNNQVELQPYEDVIYELELAKREKNPEAIRSAELKRKSHEIALTREAAIKAQQEGKNTKTFILKDKYGNVQSTFAGEKREDGNLYNIYTDEIVDVEDPKMLQQINPDSLEAWTKLSTEVGKESSDLKEGLSNYVSSIDTSKKMFEILGRSPEVTTYTASGVELARDLVGEAQTAYQVMFGKEQEIKSRIESRNVEGIEKLISEYEEDVQTFIQKSESEGGVMGASNQRIARDKAIYDSLRNALTFQMAAANGLSASKMTDADFKRFWDMIGGDKRDPNDVIRNVQNTSQMVLTKIDSQSRRFNKHPSITTFVTQWGFNPGVGLPRVEQMLIEDERPDLIDTFKMLRGDMEMRRLNAASAAQDQMPVESEQQVPSGPQAGDVIDGYEFRGGDPGDQNNWKKVN